MPKVRIYEFDDLPGNTDAVWRARQVLNVGPTSAVFAAPLGATTQAMLVIASGPVTVRVSPSSGPPASADADDIRIQAWQHYLVPASSGQVVSVREVT